MLKHNPIFDISGRTSRGKLNGYVLNHKSIVVEFIVMIIFIYTGCGAAAIYSAPPEFNFEDEPKKMRNFQAHADTTVGIFVPLVFATVVTVIAYAVGRLGSGQLNPAVSLGLYLARKQNLIQSVGMIIAQFAGALAGVGLLAATIPNSQDSNLGATTLMAGVEVWNALIGEIMMTLVLMLAILETSVSKFGGISGPLSMGFAVFFAHGVLLPLDGCSINPARSLGPAVWTGLWDDFWIFVVGPFVGAILAVPLHFYTECAPSVWDFSPVGANPPQQFLQQKNIQGQNFNNNANQNYNHSQSQQVQMQNMGQNHAVQSHVVKQ